MNLLNKFETVSLNNDDRIPHDLKEYYNKTQLEYEYNLNNNKRLIEHINNFDYNVNISVAYKSYNVDVKRMINGLIENVLNTNKIFINIVVGKFNTTYNTNLLSSIYKDKDYDFEAYHSF